MRKKGFDWDSFPIVLMVIIGILAFSLIDWMAHTGDRPEDLPELKASPIKEEIIEERVVIEKKAEKRFEKKPTDRDILAIVVMAESEGEKFIGKVAVATVVLNRASRDSLSIEEVVTSPNQFSNPYEGKVSTACYEAVDYALEHRDLFPKNMLYFRNKRYHKFGIPYMQIGNHYFSTDGEAEWDLETLGKTD